MLPFQVSPWTMFCPPLFFHTLYYWYVVDIMYQHDLSPHRLTHLLTVDFPSIPQSGGRNIKTLRWDHRLQRQNTHSAYANYEILSTSGYFWSCSCSQKILISWDSLYLVFPGLPGALLFYARARWFSCCCCCCHPICCLRRNVSLDTLLKTLQPGSQQ